MTDDVSAPGVEREFSQLVRELDGGLPVPLFCVDSDGRIRAAALPDGAIGGASLEGRPIQTFLQLGPDEGQRDASERFLGELRAAGHAVVELDRTLEHALGHERGYVVLVQRASSAPQPELMPQIIAAFPDPMFALSSERRVVVANPAFRELLSNPGNLATDEPVASLFEDPETGRRFCASLAQGEPLRERARLRGADGSAVELELVPRALFRGESEPRAWVVFARAVRDSDGLTRTEELEQCIHGMAHDLRGPLFSVRGFAGLLERELGAELPLRAREYLDSMRNALKRMEALLDGMLDLAHQRRDLASLGFISPREVLAQLASELKPELERRGILLELPHEPAEVFADPTRFYQVAANLVTNAVHHMGSVPDARIVVEITPDAGGTALIVRDNGRGVAAEYRSRIFEPFESTSSPEGTRGSGLGLAIVKRIMDAHAGSIELESDDERPGATFRAHFPGPV